MPAAKPPTVKLSDLEFDVLSDFFALLSERARKTHNDKPYYFCTFRDAKARRVAVIWPDSAVFPDCDKNWQVGQCYKLRARLIDYEKYGPQLSLVQVRPVGDEDRDFGFDPLDLIEKSRFDSPAMFAELRGLAETIADEPLRLLVLKLLDENHDRLLLARGSENKYHPFAGGWLEHTLAVTTSCQHLAEKYRTHYSDLVPPLNLDLLLAGAILHDIGRVAEFAGTFLNEPTVPGRLIGHIALGRDMVREAARDVSGLDAELLVMLEHLILSHLTLPEWGSPRLPWIPEALILHHADDLDAKLEMYVRCLTRDESPGPFTERDPALGKPLFKGRKA